MSWYDLDSNVARVCTNKARIYSIKQGLSRFEHDFKTIFIRLLYGSSTVCYGLVRLNTTFTRLTGHLQGLRTVPTTFVRVRFHTIYIRYWHGWAHWWSGLYVRLYVRSRTVSHGLARSRTVSHGLSRSCTIAKTIIHGHGIRVSFLNVLKIIHGFNRIHLNGQSVTRIRPWLVRLYVRFTRMANRISRVFCDRQALLVVRTRETKNLKLVL